MVRAEETDPKGTQSQPATDPDPAATSAGKEGCGEGAHPTVAGTQPESRPSAPSSRPGQAAADRDPSEMLPASPELAALAVAWAGLQPTVRAGILTMINRGT